MLNADGMKVSRLVQAMSCTTTAYRILKLDNGSIELRLSRERISVTRTSLGFEIRTIREPQIDI
jgi:hypothetical protein